MNQLSDRLLLLFFYGILIVALFIYSYGFFPVQDLMNPDSVFEKNYDNREEKKIEETRHQHIHKLVLFVIDALRYDFISSENRVYMPFVRSSIRKNQACLLTTVADSPTVTMPRIKAITSGIVPSFFDLIFNMETASFKQDNFVTQAVNSGYRLIFYGDDTWLRLFPNHFIRYEGVSSFFVSEYSEVDNKVTKNVYEELKRDDWDVMILHYSGLDQIGHLEGPESLLIQPKLEEMDEIVEKIVSYLKDIEAEKSIKTKFLLTGDHGMKDSGSHGGVTYPEVTVPLVSIGQSCYQLPGWPKNNTIPQMDIAPTISILLGLPIPVNSVGKLIPQLLNEMSQEEILKELENNLRLLLHNGNHTLKNNSTAQLANEYFVQLNELSDAARRSKTEIKFTFLIISCLMFWISCSFFLFKIVNTLKPKKFSHWILILGTVMHAVSYSATSFLEEEHQTWYFFWITFCVAAALESFDFNVKKLKYIKSVAEWIVIGVLHRIFRKLNQTGDKWASLPDIHGYLSSPDKRDLLLILFLLGIIGMLYCCYSERCSPAQIFVYGMTLLFIILYRLAVNSIHIEYLCHTYSRGITEVKLFWLFLLIFTIQTIYQKSPIYLIWSLIAGLLFRPHNLILIPIEILISRKIHKFYDKTKDDVWNSITHVWLGYVFYFYQGNGNSMANVDVASGFVGSENYNPISVFLLMEAHTSSAIILSYLLSTKADLIYATLRIIPHTIFCTLLIFQIHHLFIWTVFAPKLLFEFNLTIVTFTCIFLNILFNIERG